MIFSPDFEMLWILKSAADGSSAIRMALGFPNPAFRPERASFRTSEGEATLVSLNLNSKPKN